MRQMKRKACTAFLLVILLTVMNGCGEKEQIRVIELPPLELEVMDAEKLRINSIQEYAGIGRRINGCIWPGEKTRICSA